MATESRSNFWRRSAKVPGRLLPVYGCSLCRSSLSLCRSHKDTSKVNSLKAKKASSFHEFAHSTNDAWDLDDEEDEEPLRGPAPSATPPDVSVQTEGPRCDPEPSRRLQPGPDARRFQENKQHLNGKVGRSMSDARVSSSSAHTTTVQKQRALPVRPIIPLVARISDQNASGAPPMAVRDKSRLDKFRLLLASPSTDLEELRKHSWSGIPREVRPITWRLLSGYLPTNRGRRELVLQRKREEYFAFIEQYYQSRTEEHYRDTHRQIHIDIPRTNPLIPLFQQPLVQEVFERILFIWAIRHPASGYVQGINDLVTPFFVVFLSEFVTEDVENFEMSALPLQTQRSIEADTFWCMSKLLDGIQ
uniref:TBC1 domain family member 22B n=1 Tax=Tetraodon nigroviridis TaxID=99883 RepID=H3CJU5_TETNG